MKMNKLAIAVSAAVMGFASVAQAEISANIGATSNYVWRGVSQTNDQAAISGGVDYSDESGLYAGTWASNIDWGDDADASTGVEVDFYAGFSGEVSSVGYDIGAIYYFYPASKHDDSDFAELYGSVSFSAFTAGLAYTISGQNDGGLFDEGDLYYYAGASFDLPQDFSIGATIGRYTFDNDGTADYTHGQIDLGKSAGDFGDFTLSVSKADIDDPDLDDVKVFVSWAKSF